MSDEYEITLENDGLTPGARWRYVVYDGEVPIDSGAWEAYELAHMSYRHARAYWLDGDHGGLSDWPDDMDPDGWAAAETGVVR